MVPMAQPMAVRSRCEIASAMYEPIPGRTTVVSPTLMDSAATTKNHPPDMDIIMFHISAGIAKGTSSCQNRIHGLSMNESAASVSSAGTVRSDW